MAIDLKKNKDSLQKVYNEVVSDNCKTDWVVFGYEGLSPVLKVVESGDGGIEELADELNSGKIQYAYCRVIDPNTSLPKYVLINWQGEGAQDSFKLKCTAHLRDIQSFLKTVHVSINARTEADIDEDDIIKRVAKASGANYSFHKEKAKAVEAPAPVGTDYHRVIPTRDINTKSRDKFWAETEKEEVKRREEENQKAQQAKKQAEEERKDRELREAKERDKRTKEHIRTVRQQKEAELKANALSKEAEKERWEKQQQEVYKDDEDRRQRSDQLRRVRAAEAVSLASGSAPSARDFFKQKSVERPDADARRGPPPPRKLKSAFTEEQQVPQEPARREPIQLPKSEPQEPQPELAYAPESPTYQPQSPTEPEYPSHQQQEPSYEPEPEPEVAAVPASDPTAPQPRNLLRDELLPRQNSEEEEEEVQNWDEPPQEDFSPPSQQPQVPAQETSSPEEQVNGNEGGGDQGLCARALYDYQAADDTEISFDPDDIITNIDLIDEGWWQGFAPDGSYGMFPANYVELIQ